MIDSETHEPLRDAKVVAVRSEYHSEIKTGSDGKYDLAPMLQWHWLVYLGDPGVYPLPIYLRDDGGGLLVVTASASGYSPQQATYRHGVYSQPPGPKFDETVEFALKRSSP